MSCDVALMNYTQHVKGMLLLANVELAVAVEASDFLRNSLAPAGPCLWSRSGFSSNYRTWSVRIEHCSLIGVRGNVFWVLGKAMVVVVKSFCWYFQYSLILWGALSASRALSGLLVQLFVCSDAVLHWPAPYLLPIHQELVPYVFPIVLPYWSRSGVDGWSGFWGVGLCSSFGLANQMMKILQLGYMIICNTLRVLFLQCVVGWRIFPVGSAKGRVEMHLINQAILYR